MIVINTIKEALDFIDFFDGRGMVATDEELQLETLKENFELIDDIINEDYNGEE